jgi:hypothetical protein
MRRAARSAYEEHFTARANYRSLMRIYTTVIPRGATQPARPLLAGQEGAQ